MKKRSVRTTPSQFLSGWKEIGNYLGKGVRTVQRYERTMGLPVRRPAGKSRGSVVAVKAELDGWVTASPIREVFHLRGTIPEHPSATHQIKKGLSELAQLREQMATLRAELKTSVQQLHNSVIEVSKGLVSNNWKRPVVLVSSDELDLLDQKAAQVMNLPAKFPKAS